MDYQLRYLGVNLAGMIFFIGIGNSLGIKWTGFYIFIYIAIAVLSWLFTLFLCAYGKRKEQEAEEEQE